MSEKKPVRLSIFNQTYSLLVSGDPADIERAATEVDELMTTIARAGNVDSNRIAVLACLHLQTRIQALEAEIERFRSDVDNKTRRFAGMLDELIRAQRGESA
ncbi:MAG TPA: cell division protein ZapA [Bryobacteraceae bacterium]|nr:cell division protein ZapA [Bryobacteraceae bacterium]